MNKYKHNTIDIFFIIVIGLMTGGIFFLMRLTMVVSKNKDRTIGKFRRYFYLLCDWVLLDGDSITRFFEDISAYDIAVYGSGKIGLLFSDIVLKQSSGVRIKCFLDKYALTNASSNGIPIYRPGKDTPDFDAIVVTPLMEFDEIKKELSDMYQVSVFSLKEVIESAKKNCNSSIELS